MSDARKPAGRTPSSASNPALPIPEPTDSSPGTPDTAPQTAPDPNRPPRRTNPGGVSARTTNPGGASARRTNPGGAKVATANRARRPRPGASKYQQLLERLKAEGSNAALNAASIARELVEDFRRSDQFFKYKAIILASWVVLSLGTLIGTCAHHSGLDAKNRLGARLGPASSDPLHPAVTIFNESNDSWDDVTVIVNKTFRAAVSEVQGHGGYITITPRQLMGPDNNLAPPDIRVTDVELRTSDGKARLMKDGLEQ